MDNYKLSIIIPMYNCCDNVLGTLLILGIQMLGIKPRPVEVIVVDDGSTEDGAVFVEANCNACGFIYYRQDNAGGASACNKGLELATGEYLTFIDADDSITDVYLSSILSEIDSGQFDFITHRWQYPDGTIGGRHDPPLVNWNVWGNVYRTSLVKDVKFDEDINVAWDMDWLRRAYRPDMKQLDSDVVTNIYDTSNPESITNKFNRGELTIRKSDTQNNS